MATTETGASERRRTGPDGAESRGLRPGEAEAEPPRRRLRQRVLRDVRTRILASYVLLLAIALLVSVALVRQILEARLDNRIQAELAQEIEEFQTVAQQTRPGGKPYSSIDQISRAYFARNVPGADEVVLAIAPRGEARSQSPAGIPRRGTAPAFENRVDGWRMISAPEEGEFESAEGVVRYQAVPVAGQGEDNLGTFVVAGFIDGEREEVSEAVSVVAIVSAGILLIGTAVAFSISSRVLAPLRDLAVAARSASGSDMRGRIEARGSDEIAELARTFNRMMDRLESSFTSQREFTRDVSHELRTPIAVVRGHLELLGEGTVPEEERRESIELVTDELDRMNRFVEDLLVLARVENPDFLREQTIELDSLCEDILAKARATAERDWQLASTTRRSVVGDPQRLTQALMSLISNAVRQTPEGGRIAVGAAVDGQMARLWVDDDGPGVPKAERDRIFERFARGSTGRGSYEGSGMGLAIVKAIAEAHGGSIRVTDSPLGGARFEITLPVESGGEPEIPVRKGGMA